MLFCRSYCKENWEVQNDGRGMNLLSTPRSINIQTRNSGVASQSNSLKLLRSH